jgi:hypothetical protein
VLTSCALLAFEELLLGVKGKIPEGPRYSNLVKSWENIEQLCLAIIEGQKTLNGYLVFGESSICESPL